MSFPLLGHGSGVTPSASHGQPQTRPLGRWLSLSRSPGPGCQKANKTNEEMSDGRSLDRTSYVAPLSQLDSICGFLSGT